MTLITNYNKITLVDLKFDANTQNELNISTT